MGDFTGAFPLYPQERTAFRLILLALDRVRWLGKRILRFWAVGAQSGRTWRDPVGRGKMIRKRGNKTILPRPNGARQGGGYLFL